MSRTNIRRARADDARFLAWVMLAASRSHLARGAWDLYVDGEEPRALALLERMATQPEPSFCRWEHFLVAETDGSPAAALAAYAPRDPGLLDPSVAIAAASRDALGWNDAQRRAADARLAPFLTCAAAPQPNAWAVEWVATTPAARRRGLGRELLEAAIEVGRTRGFGESEIMILIGNTPAQRVYERAGYGVVGERRHPQFARAMGCPGIACLTRTLRAT